MRDKPLTPGDVVAVLGPMSPNMYAVKYVLEMLGINSVVPFTSDGKQLNNANRFHPDNIPVKADRNRLMGKEVILVVDCDVLLPSTCVQHISVTNPGITLPITNDSTLLLELVAALESLGRKTDTGWLKDVITTDMETRFAIPLLRPSEWVNVVYNGKYGIPSSSFIEYQQTQLEFDLSHNPSAKSKLSELTITKLFRDLPTIKVKGLSVVNITDCDIPCIEQLLLFAKRPFFKMVNGYAAVFMGNL